MPQIIKARVEPDGSIHLLESVRFARTVEVDVVLPENVVIELQTDSSQTELADTRAKRLTWLKAYREQHGGQYVALAGDELVATGRTMREAKEAAHGAGEFDVFVTYLSKPYDVVEMGGWL